MVRVERTIAGRFPAGMAMLTAPPAARRSSRSKRAVRFVASPGAHFRRRRHPCGLHRHRARRRAARRRPARRFVRRPHGKPRRRVTGACFELLSEIEATARAPIAARVARMLVDTAWGQERDVTESVDDAGTWSIAAAKTVAALRGGSLLRCDRGRCRGRARDVSRRARRFHRPNHSDTRRSHGRFRARQRRGLAPAKLQRRPAVRAPPRSPWARPSAATADDRRHRRRFTRRDPKDARNVRRVRLRHVERPVLRRRGPAPARRASARSALPRGVSRPADRSDPRRLGKPRGRRRRAVAASRAGVRLSNARRLTADDARNEIIRTARPRIGAPVSA